MVEQDESESLIVAATNHVGILDRAFFRRFDDIIKYELPDTARITETLKAKLGQFYVAKDGWAKLAKLALGLSFADITRACEDAIKDALIQGDTRVTQAQVAHALQDRKVSVTHKSVGSRKS